jgi:hypothetical protein
MHAIFSLEKLEWKRPLERTKCGWENNIRLDIRELEWEGVTGFIWLRIWTSGWPL